MCEYNVYFFTGRMWEQLASSLNSAGYGPAKLPKTWAKVRKIYDWQNCSFSHQYIISAS